MEHVNQWCLTLWPLWTDVFKSSNCQGKFELGESKTKTS